MVSAEGKRQPPLETRVCLRSVVKGTPSTTETRYRSSGPGRQRPPGCAGVPHITVHVAVTASAMGRKELMVRQGRLGSSAEREDPPAEEGNTQCW